MIVFEATVTLMLREDIVWESMILLYYDRCMTHFESVRAWARRGYLQSISSILHLPELDTVDGTVTWHVARVRPKK